MAVVFHRMIIRMVAAGWGYRERPEYWQLTDKIELMASVAIAVTRYDRMLGIGGL